VFIRGQLQFLGSIRCRSIWSEYSHWNWLSWKKRWDYWGIAHKRERCSWREEAILSEIIS